MSLYLSLKKNYLSLKVDSYILSQNRYLKKIRALKNYLFIGLVHD